MSKSSRIDQPKSRPLKQPPERNTRARSHPDATWHRVFDRLDREGQSLNIQIRQAIVRAIETGLLQSGDRMPSSRHLSAMLGLGRNTITNAFQMLMAEGVLVSRQRSGVFVTDRKAPQSLPKRHEDQSDLWQDRFAACPSAYRHFDKPKDWQDYPYPFLYGQFDPTIFPSNNWREATRATSSMQEISSWASDQIDDDDPELVEQLRVQVLPKRGIFATSDEIIITLGSQQALSMLVQLLVGRSTRVGIEDPGYPDLRNMVKMATDRPIFLTMDDKGAVPDAQFAQCDVAFVTVAHQCPTTLTMPPDRCRALLGAAEEHDVVLVEDDYEAELNLELSANIPPLKSMDEAGRVAYVGSFSKAFAPGLRIGFIVAPSKVIDELRLLRRLLMRHPPTNNQRVLATFIGLGHYQRHLDKTSAILERRAKLISDLLPIHLPHCSWTRDLGAKSFWITLPQGVDGGALEKIAKEHGVLIEAGDIFFADKAQGSRNIRLAFSSVIETHIQSGLKILGDLIADMIEV